MKTNRIIILLLGLLYYIQMTSCEVKENQTQPVPTKEIETGMVWAEGQAFPHFAVPTDTLDGFLIEDPSLTSEEKVMFTVLQGLINKTKPSVILLRPGGEGMYRWPDNLGLHVREYPADRKWELLRKYKEKIDGVILYSVEKSAHYRNLATTAAGLKNALPVTAAEYEQILSLGIKFPVIENLSSLPYTAPEDIYRYLYNTYWKDCTKRLLISHSALVFIRDIAVASKAAVVWLDPRKEKENEVIRLFLNDMKAGESIILGWWAEERSGIGIGTEYGISTVPADFYDNATVYAGMNHVINLPVTPKKPDMENKIYLTVFLSDGDNIQYCQHTMPKLWDNKGRGSIPVNWTVSPGLADLGPQLLNYFYKTATPNDFLASGPSGLGYALIYDAHNRKWFNTGGESFDRYAKFTQNYLEKSGLRVITIWDQINENQMESYATYCRYLYGATQQDWQKQPDKIPAFIKQNRLAFLPNYPCYTNSTDVFVNMNRDTIANFDGSHPIFLTAQGVSWRMGPDSLVILKEKLEKLAPGNIVFCRGDHFFALYNEANRLNFNLTLSSQMKITSSSSVTPPEFAADGTCALERSWISSAKGKKWIRFDFGETYKLNRYVVRHAETSGLDKDYNTGAFQIETSVDGKKWQIADKQSGNDSAVTDVDFTPVQARYVRLTVTDAGKDGIARICDVEIYGSKEELKVKN
ncbi:hypothetical protein AGMMS50239_30900 [Bacteroidia bacterium]|nr:hypothetical protein AGMMS50239_30900 [Bacteroidia bacterium]